MKCGKGQSVRKLKSEWGGAKVEYSDFSFAIGRSNRDFDFLVEAWRFIPQNYMLIIASDTYNPKSFLPKNIIHRRDIVGNNQFPYILNCKVIIIPIDDGTICSGDTVLLRAMSFRKPVVVTSPSTLGEMYIDDGINGMLIEKNPEIFALKITELLNNEKHMKQLGQSAREKFELEYSRIQMGTRLGEMIKV